MREAQKTQDLENKDNETAWDKLQKFTRGESLEIFQKQLGLMKPGDIRRTGLDLLEQQEKLKREYV